MLVFLWRERAAIHAYEFRWLFGAGCAFAVLTIVLGYIIPGIDNAAHIGGFITGLLASIIFSQTITARVMPARFSVGAVLATIVAGVLLFKNIPPPTYRWSDELLLRSQINAFLYQDQAINRSWLEIMHDSKQGKASLDELAGKIDYSISEPYEQSFERLSQLPSDPKLPSAAQLENILRYAEQRKDASKALADRLREQAP